MLAWALSLPFLHSALSFSLQEMPPMQMEAAAQSKEVDELILQGESDRTTVVTFTVKAYITPEVASAYPNATESIEYLKNILNKQYKRSMIPIRMEIHCIEKTKTSEAQGLNTLAAFMKYKRSHKELRGSADAAALFATSGDYGIAMSANPPNGDTMISVNQMEGSLNSRILFSHELGHNFGASHSDGYRLPGTNMGSLMNSTDECCHDEHGFYSNPEVKIDGIPTGDKNHNVAGMIRRHRFLVAQFGDESFGCDDERP